MAKKNNIQKTYGIVGQIYYILKHHNVYKNTVDFFCDFLSIRAKSNNHPDYNPLKWSAIANYDYYDASALSDLDERLSDENKYKETIAKKINLLSDSRCRDINEQLGTILDSITTYATKRNPETCDFKEYDPNCIRLLGTYFKAKKDFYDLSYNIYILIYFSAHKCLPENFFFGSSYKADLEEFNKEVVCKYGVLSMNGTRAIIVLAEREKPNIFALYEYACMLHYGNPYGPDKNLQKAFRAYKMAAGLNRISNTIESTCNPLALWALSFIYFNYRNPKSAQLGECAKGTIGELDDLSALERIQGAAYYASMALNLNHDSSSANLLGRIASITEAELPGITKIKKRFNLRTAKEYFELSSQDGYVYAANNSANIELEAIFTDPQNSKQHIEQYLYYLNQSANEYEPWAANRLGLIYLHGKIQSPKNPELSVSFSQDRDMAKKYFHLAIDHFNDYGSSWAYANLLVYFPEEYVDDYEKFLRHNKRIDELNNAEARSFVAKHATSITDFKYKTSAVKPNQ